MYQIIKTITRTNFYQTRDDAIKPYISFNLIRIKCQTLPARPYAEIFYLF